MATLHLVLKEEPFFMIAAGTKQEEYRDLKPYWTKRLTTTTGQFRHFDLVRFQHGYTTGRTLEVECLGIYENEERQCYAIVLGRIVSRTNC